MVRNAREANIEGVQAAIRLHQELDLRDSSRATGGGIKVFESIDQKGHALLFRPLDGLLGLCVHTPATGVLISTKRHLSVQRFTAAHELGHLEMGHDFSFDNEETIWRPHGSSQSQLQEISANAFGAEFLMPKWLLREKMERHGWSAESLASPDVVYQMALRLGVSYEALYWTLIKYKWVDSSTQDTLKSTKPKAIKENLLNGLALKDPWADVWKLTPADHDEFIEAGPNDTFILKLPEHGNGGYLWNIEELKEHGFDVQTHGTEVTEEVIGSPQTREWWLTSDMPISGDFLVSERRPWNEDDAINHFEFSYSLWGKESGIPRFQRPQLAAA